MFGSGSTALTVLSSFMVKNIVFRAEAEYSYFLTDFRRKIFWSIVLDFGV